MLLIFLHRGYAQITISQADFANPGDTVLMSDAKVNQLLSYHTTGANTTWDYSTLQYNGQHVDTFFKETSADAFYILYFSNVSFNSHRSNMFITNGVTGPILPLIPLTITNTQNFLYKSSSQFVDQGFGAQINGLPLPIAYSHPDVLYNFPVLFGNADTSTSGYSIPLPGVGYYGYEQTRTNTVDGWGTLITPWDTFPVLRVLSEITSFDTFYINTISAGIKIPRFKQRQYKWIANKEQEPVLQINTQVLFLNIEVISNIVYRDSFHVPPVAPVSGIQDPATTGFAFNVFPNPANENFTVQYHSIENTPEAFMRVTDIRGRLVLSKRLTENSETVDASAWEKGIYFVIISNGTQMSVRKLIIQ